MKKIFLTFCIAALVTFSTSFASAEDSVGKKQLEASITRLINVLTDPELSKDRLVRREKIKEILNARFSAEEMAKRTLAKNWKEISEKEQKEFADVLRRLIISSYINKIEEYKDEEVIYRNEQLLKDRYMEIETTVVGGKDSYSVNYKIKDFAGNWLVYDIYIEGVSLINNYKSQFMAFLEKKSFSELLSDLKQKLQEVEDKDLESMSTAKADNA